MNYAYHIRVQGQLTEDWSEWFAGVRIQPRQNGETELQGCLDQAALHGILARIRDLNLVLLAVNLVEDVGQLS